MTEKMNYATFTDGDGGEQSPCRPSELQSTIGSNAKLDLITPEILTIPSESSRNKNDSDLMIAIP